MIADIVAQDADGNDVLLVEVKGMVLDQDLLPEYLEWFVEEGASFPFAMIADRKSISIFELDPGDPSRFTRSDTLSTPDVLRHYDPDFEEKRIFQGYLRALVEAWLHDLAYHWKMENPPGSDRLAALGLLERLAGGTTRTEVPLGADAVR